MCRPTRTNSHLQLSSSQFEEDREYPRSSESLTTSAGLPSIPVFSHDSVEKMHISLYCRSATIATGVLVLIGIRSRIFADTIVCSNFGVSSTDRSSFAPIYFSIALCFVLLLLSTWKGTLKDCYTDFPRSPIKVSNRNASYVALSGLSRVTSVDAFKKISKNLLHSLDSCSLRAALQAITRKECFARLDYIERLSINDVAILYRYSVSLNQIGFDKSKFLSEQSEIVRAVITAMDMAVKVSRGCLRESRKVRAEERAEGGVDALYFVAATRVFAEWRTLRLVPKGYQRYAVGLSLGYRDVLQNLEKIERSVHEYLRHHQDNQSDGNHPALTAPTLRELLQFEADLNVHKRLPILEDRSAASGVLWTKRQLHYQVVTLNNSLEVPEFYSSSKDAASAAYRIVYEDYHGWAIKQFFLHSFNGSPPLDALWTNMDPPTETLLLGSDKKLSQEEIQPSPSFKDMPERTMSDVSEKSMDKRKEEDNEFLVALDNFNRLFIEKWEDVLRMVNCGRDEKKKKKQNLVLSSESHFDLNALNQGSKKTRESGLASTEIEILKKRKHSNVDPVERSKRSTEDFVREVSPMIADLGQMLEKLNMNDPTRV